ncbi:hypothetical protein D1831_13200 [Lactiplantibacillus garii]|uniref:Phage protein n=1 Tax=Lactiplantibacillus garii TaxID=2306423 RepID=A0A426D3V2_9LACO|nr:hypothetical protein [Lactiplantibacillus garii]RRK09357.1 hypothetical protein D1831_13200 [Lactiplantibacillus garii]
MQKRYNDLYQLTDINSDCEKALTLLSEVKQPCRTALVANDLIRRVLKKAVDEMPDYSRLDADELRKELDNQWILFYSALSEFQATDNSISAIENKLAGVKHVIANINDTAAGVNAAIKEVMTRDEEDTDHE